MLTTLAGGTTRRGDAGDVGVPSQARLMHSSRASVDSRTRSPTYHRFRVAFASDGRLCFIGCRARAAAATRFSLANCRWFCRFSFGVRRRRGALKLHRVASAPAVRSPFYLRRRRRTSYRSLRVAVSVVVVVALGWIIRFARSLIRSPYNKRSLTYLLSHRWG